MAVGIVLAGGYGTRMRPLTDGRPKHLLPVGPDPLIVHQLRRLADAGINDVVLATGYCADQFEPALGDGSRWGVRLSYAAESEPLGTGGALRHAWASSRSVRAAPTVVVLNGDLLSGHDLQAHLAAYERGGDVCLHVRSVPDPRAYGSVECADDGVVTAFVEKPAHPVGDLINAGTYVVAGEVVASIPTGRTVSWEREVLPELVARGGVRAYAEQAYFRDVGSPAALVAASADAVLGRLTGDGLQAGFWTDPSASISPDARVDRGSAVHAGARVEAGARVSGSIVMSGAVVGAEAQVLDAVVPPEAVVPAGRIVRTGVAATAASEA